jgi:hypothetical protein
MVNYINVLRDYSRQNTFSIVDCEGRGRPWPHRSSGISEMKQDVIEDWAAQRACTPLVILRIGHRQIETSYSREEAASK